ncbi:3-oxoacyl-[acyl-carrier-protein] synthase II, chloroplastic [Cocos nucifera]|uniref:beta-ketoacyl-[acyl-carrier-protein] synthase I n=1 Tax=Cocos nucifera TaxID=13894 RepID=A0A8K0ISF3_COCNU|nr:3-oxoacyl-[acyl-carrier-protein] synthase II, chloroplastic [Cocos nucifera]
MVGATVASPLCTWLVAPCMTVACDKERSLGPRSVSPRRRWREASLSGGGGRGSPRRLISAFCGAGIQGLMSSCLAFEPCAEFYSSRNGSAFFGGNGFSLFGPQNAATTRRQRRAAHSSASSGKVMSIAVQPEKKVAEKKRTHTKQQRVVVTGMGVVTPLGHDPDNFYEKLLKGVSGISEIETFDCSSYPTRIAGEIKSFSSDGWVAPKLSKRMDKFMLYLLTAGKKALENGGLTEEVMSWLDKERCGVLIGSAMGGMKVFNDAIEALRISYKKMNPFCVPFATTNMGSAMLAMDLGWMGPNYSISTACATSNFCILNAANHIIRDEADVMLCGGSDAAIIPIGLGGFVACGALSQRNSDPTKASRPWDIDCDGFVMGEGAGVLLLEELEHAKQRGAEIYAEFLGGSFTCDAYHMTEPHPEGTGIILCIEKALAESGAAREDVNYVNAHATSTPSGDLKEYQALIHCFGQNPEGSNPIRQRLRLECTFWAIQGYCVTCAKTRNDNKAIRTGWVHPNVNLDNPDENVDVNKLVGSNKERLDVKVALSNSFGFGGHNSSILFAPYK